MTRQDVCFSSCPREICTLCYVLMGFSSDTVQTLLVTSSSPFKDAVSKYSHVLGCGSEGVSVAGVLGRKAQLALFSRPSLNRPPPPNRNKKVTVNAK